MGALMHVTPGSGLLAALVLVLAAGCAEPGNGADADSDTDTDVDSDTDTDSGPEGTIKNFDADGIPENGGDFVYGVKVGATEHDRAYFASHYGGRATLALAVWVDRVGAEVEMFFEDEVSPEDGGFVHQLVSGLRFGQQYRYAFLEKTAGGGYAERSRIGTFRTAPRDHQLVPVTLAGTHGTFQGQGGYEGFPYLTASSEYELDFFIHLGDITYNDGAQEIEQFRTKWDFNMKTQGFKDIFAATTWYSVWDDHEVTDNYNPEIHPARFLSNAFQVYFEFLPVPRDPDHPDRIWRSYRWGRTAELFLLDCRSERKPSSRATAGAIYISEAQLDWLLEELAGSDAVFKLIANSVPITDFPVAFDFGGANEDRWEGYASQRVELLDAIAAQGTEHVYWLSGDFHIASVGWLEPDKSRGMHEILMGPGGAMENPAGDGLPKGQFSWGRGTLLQDHADTVTVVRLDPTKQPPEFRVTFYELDGTVLHDEVLKD